MIQIDEFPLTINGKLDKARLPEPDMLESSKYVPPSNKTEQAIVDVFEEILGVSPVGIEDSFFELGGHSLKATAAINAIEKKTGIRLPVKEIFSSPTPAMLAKRLRPREKANIVQYQKQNREKLIQHPLHRNDCLFWIRWKATVQHITWRQR